MSAVVQKYEWRYSTLKRDTDESWSDYRKRQDAITDCFKDELEGEVFGNRLQMISKAKLDRLWDIAWSNGHSSGYNEVYNYYVEMADLLDPNY